MVQLGATFSYHSDSLRRYRHFNQMDFWEKESGIRGPKYINIHKWLHPLMQHGVPRDLEKELLCNRTFSDYKRNNVEWMMWLTACGSMETKSSSCRRPKWRVLIIRSFAPRFMHGKVYHFWLHGTDVVKNRAGAGMLLGPVACEVWKRAGSPDFIVKGECAGAAWLIRIEVHFLDRFEDMLLRVIGNKRDGCSRQYKTIKVLKLKDWFTRQGDHQLLNMVGIGELNEAERALLQTGERTWAKPPFAFLATARKSKCIDDTASILL